MLNYNENILVANVDTSQNSLLLFDLLFDSKGIGMVLFIYTHISSEDFYSQTHSQLLH